MTIKWATRILVVGWCVLMLGVVSSFAYALHIQNEAEASAGQLDAQTKRAIQQNCAEIEDVKSSLRSVFERLARFNIESQTPSAEQRALLYADFVNDYFSPKPCPRTKEE
jgi:hypothetical protein